MDRVVLVCVVLAGCSHHPPDAQFYQVIFNPICIIKCDANQQDNPVAKGNIYNEQRE